MPPTAESTAVLQQALQRLDQLPNAQDIRQRILIATRFYSTYSSTKPAVSDAEQMCEMLTLSSQGTMRLSELANRFGIRANGVYNAWEIMHRLLTICLSEQEMCAIGLSPTVLPSQYLRIQSIYETYTQAYTRLSTNIEILPVLAHNAHFAQFVSALSQGKGVAGFLKEYTGSDWNISFDPGSLHIAEDAYRYGLAHGVSALRPLTGVESKPRPAYDHNFLRRALFARYLNLCVRGDQNPDYVTGEYVIRALQRVRDIPAEHSPQRIYLRYLQSMVAKFPYYESLLVVKAERSYKSAISQMDKDSYLDLYQAHGMTPFPIDWIVGQIATGRDQMDIVDTMQSRGIAYAASTLRDEISTVGRFMENLLLASPLHMCGDELFCKSITHTHKSDIAMLTNAASGRDIVEG